MILLIHLAVSPLFAQENLSIGSTKITTFVKKVNGAGDLTATVQAADGDYVIVSRIPSTSLLEKTPIKRLSIGICFPIFDLVVGLLTGAVEIELSHSTIK